MSVLPSPKFQNQAIIVVSAEEESENGVVSPRQTEAEEKFTVGACPIMVMLMESNALQPLESVAVMA